MKNNRRFIALSLAACMALAAVPALAGDAAPADGVPALVEQTGSRPQQAPPQAPGRNDSQPTPPQLPDGAQDGGSQPTPPQLPDGAQDGGRQQHAHHHRSDRSGGREQRPDSAQSGDSRQTPPQRPDQNGGQTPPDMPGGQDNGAPSEYSAASVVTESSEGASYASEAGGENAVLVSSGAVTLSGATVSKTGSTDGENADFYGVNAAVLATGGAALAIENAEITSDGAHANGVFSYGAGTTVTVTDTAIVTAGNSSGGLMTTGGAALNATNVTVSTAGNSSAAIRSDRGGGTVLVNGGSFDTAGVGSPAIYSTADITVKGATLSAASSEAVVIEGGNSVTLIDAAVSGNDAVLNGQSSVRTNVLIYQSMSGDAATGASSFAMTGGSMTALTGDMFHVTNVATEISLSGVGFAYADDSGVFLSASADAWGQSGRNGGSVTLNLIGQEASGDITADALSSVALNLTDGSAYAGAINPDGAAGSVTVTLDADSTWTLTGDSYVSGVSGDLSRISLNGFRLYVGGEAAGA